MSLLDDDCRRREFNFSEMHLNQTAPYRTRERVGQVNPRTDILDLYVLMLSMAVLVALLGVYLMR